MAESVFDKLKSFGDYQREAEAFELKKQQAKRLAQGTTPAAMQLANEYQKRLDAGDEAGANTLAQFAKTVDKGIQVGADGAYQPMAGYGQALGQNKYQEKLGGNMADLQTAGAISGAQANARNTSDLAYSPQIKAATTEADIAAKSKADAAASLPKVESQSQGALDLITSIRNDPGLPAVIGAPNPFQGRIPLVGNIAGSPAADFQAKIDQLGGKQFLEAFESLKGAGQITEVEGKKATNAIGRMQTSQSEDAFLKALTELEGVVKGGVERAKTKAGAPPPSLPKEGERRGAFMFIGGNPNDKNSWRKVQ